MLTLAATLVSALLLGGAAIATAYVAAPHLHHSLEWSWEPWVLTSLGLGTAWYSAALIRMKRRNVLPRIVSRVEIAHFYGGIGVLALALVTPIDTIADQLFSVHMVQHLLLLLAAPPLFVIARPYLSLIWAFPSHVRKAIGRYWVGLGVTRAVGVLMHPVPVWLLFSGSFIFWHLPGPYQWALRNDFVHALEHLSFFITGLMFWTLVIEPSGRRRMAYGWTLIFILSTAVVSGMPGALITVAPRPLYPAYANGAARWGLTLMQDQQLAGVIMWIPGGATYLTAMSVTFVKWLQSEERKNVAFRRQTALLVAAFLVASLCLFGSIAPSHATQIGVTGGNARQGARLIRQEGCGGCHVIPGIGNASGDVGPPLNGIGERVYIAGVLRNTPQNLELWLEKPQSVVPGNAMPNMGIDATSARNIAAYLYTLH